MSKPRWAVWTGVVMIAASPAVFAAPSATAFDPSMLGGERLDIHLPDGRALRFRTTTEALSGSSTGIRGRSESGDRIYLYRSHDGLSGDIYAYGGRFRLVPREGGYAWVRAQDDARVRMPAETWEGVAPYLPSGRNGQALIAARDAAGVTTIDLLVLTTAAFEQRLGGPEPAYREAERLVFVANGYFESSGVPVRYRLLDVEKYTGTSESSGLYRNLETMLREPLLHRYRDTIGADLVMLLKNGQACTGMVGLSAGFNGFAQSDPPLDIDARRDFVAGAAMGPDENGVRCDDFIFAHELGHNLAAGHNYLLHRADALYWKPYAHGYDCGFAGPELRYASIMSYGESGAGVEARGDFFSSPSLNLDGTPCGSDGVAQAEVTQADNVRVMQEAAPYVAAYRDSRKSRVSGAGTEDQRFGGAMSASLLGFLILTARMFRFARSRRGSDSPRCALRCRRPRSPSS